MDVKMPTHQWHGRPRDGRFLPRRCPQALPRNATDLFSMFPPRSPTQHFFQHPEKLEVTCLQSLCLHCRELEGVMCVSPHGVRRARETLSNFCLVSRHARKIAELILYRYINIGYLDLFNCASEFIWWKIPKSNMAFAVRAEQLAGFG